jgi:hypothetical protein
VADEAALRRTEPMLYNPGSGNQESWNYKVHDFHGFDDFDDFNAFPAFSSPLTAILVTPDKFWQKRVSNGVH